MTNLAPHRGWSWRIRLGAASAALALVVLGRIVVMTPSAEAQADATFTVLYSLKGGTDGAYPQAGLLRDAAGNLYGTTADGGGASNCGFLGCGTGFKLDTTGTETLLYTFTGNPDGRGPLAGLVRDAGGNLYGTTAYGGGRDLGTVFKIDPSGTETVLHTFIGPPDGRYPLAGLVGDGAGHLYGTTQYGGANDETGTVFKLNLTGKGNLLHSFKDRADGQFPYAGLVRDAAGNLYGTTSKGGAFGSGTVFSWIQLAARPCCTASLAPRMGGIPSQV